MSDEEVKNLLFNRRKEYIAEIEEVNDTLLDNYAQMLVRNTNNRLRQRIFEERDKIVNRNEQLRKLISKLDSILLIHSPEHVFQDEIMEMDDEQNVEFTKYYSVDNNTKKRGLSQITVMRRLKSSHKSIDMNALDKLDSHEIDRHIRNLRSLISKSPEDKKILLRTKLEALLDHKEARIKNGRW